MKHKERVRLIRRRVVAGGVGLFAAVWLLITATLVSGKDPGLAATTTTARVATTTTATAPTTTTARSTARAHRSTKATTAATAPVTTRQS